MGRYEKYRKPKPTQKKGIVTVRNVIIVIELCIAIAGFIILIVMHL